MRAGPARRGAADLILFAPAEAPDRKRAQFFQSAEAIGITVGDDKPAQHEKEVDEKISSE
jgi:hypothetical protein